VWSKQPIQGRRQFVSLTSRVVIPKIHNLQAQDHPMQLRKQEHKLPRQRLREDLTMKVTPAWEAALLLEIEWI
jgi:hypothetical protein